MTPSENGVRGLFDTSTCASWYDVLDPSCWGFQAGQWVGSTVSDNQAPQSPVSGITLILLGVIVYLVARK